MISHARVVSPGCMVSQYRCSTPQTTTAAATRLSATPMMISHCADEFVPATSRPEKPVDPAQPQQHLRAIVQDDELPLEHRHDLGQGIGAVIAENAIGFGIA